MKYAHVEREQRWLLARVPEGARRSASIVDRYIDGTRLRLRRIERETGVVLKLGQKVRAVPSDPEVADHTTLYLSGEEFGVLAALPAVELRKTRWHADHAGRRVAIDEFCARLDGLVLAEVELEADEPRLAPPAYALRDVTGDDRFSGGMLARASDRAIAALLREIR